MSFSFYKSIIRPIIFKIPPESAHNLSLNYLRFKPSFKFSEPNDDLKILKTTICGINLATPIGLAAGYDKNFYTTNELYNLGFGFVVGGTITLEPRLGNGKPRVIRDLDNKAIINSLGFPGEGVEKISSKIKKLHASTKRKIFVSISGNSVTDISKCYDKIKSYSDLVEINISSPNTKDLIHFHKQNNLLKLIENINQQKECPIFIKMPPLYKRGEMDENVLKLIELSYLNEIDGITISNKLPVSNNYLHTGKGGLSGKPLFNDTINTIKSVTKITNKNYPIIACGGISSAEEVWECIANGSKAVQLYTGLIYEGLSLPKLLSKNLIKMMHKAKINSISEIKGSPPKID